MHNYSFSNFIITAQVYAKWWLYPLLVMCGMALAYLLMRINTILYINHQRKLETILAETAKQLQQRNDELEKRNAVKSRLVSIVNHDVITPLKFLAATCKNLLEKRRMITDEIRDETIHEMMLASKDLQFLTTNILNWIKYQGGSKGLVKDNFPLRDMAHEMLKNLSATAAEKNLQIINNIPPHIDVYQYYDALKVLIYNLAANAIKFTDSGDVTIGANITQEYVNMWVSDQGIGMTEEQIRNLLVGKTNIHAIKKQPGAEQGLGYQIIRDLLQITRAIIAIESVPGKGTTVYVKFAVEEAKFNAEENS